MRILREPSQRLPRRPGRSRTNRSAHVPAPIAVTKAIVQHARYRHGHPAVHRLLAAPIARPFSPSGQSKADVIVLALND